MSMTGAKKMEVLLDQIELPKDIRDKHFKSAKLEKLIVHRQSKVWHFHFHFENVLPPDVYQLFILKLNTAFSNIAAVKWNIQTENNKISSTYMKEYWNIFISEIVKASPRYKSMEFNKPIVNDNNIMLTCQDDIQLQSIKKNIEPQYRSFCEKIGASFFTIDIEINQEQDEIQKFKERKDMEDKAFVQQAVKQIKS